MCARLNVAVQTVNSMKASLVGSSFLFNGVLDKTPGHEDKPEQGDGAVGIKVATAMLLSTPKTSMNARFSTTLNRQRDIAEKVKSCSFECVYDTSVDENRNVEWDVQEIEHLNLGHNVCVFLGEAPRWYISVVILPMKASTAQPKRPATMMTAFIPTRLRLSWLN